MNTGIITLMGSGELTGSMVEVHKALLNHYGDDAKAVFLDTPAGFQLNAEDISAKAIEYFKTRVQRPLIIASFKSLGDIGELEIQKTYEAIRRADYILIGPGSPTYALGQWRESAIPDLFVRHIQKGGCIVAASAAALTMGRLTLPVYEIYKVGQDPHWVDGMNVLKTFGFHWAVLPHWNNAEGGSHDTRYCFMGEPRLSQLEAQLPDEVDILGLDEHTALVIDLSRESSLIKGIGQVTLRRKGRERVCDPGEDIPLHLLRNPKNLIVAVAETPVLQAGPTSVANPDKPKDPVWIKIHALEKEIQLDLENHQPGNATQKLLALESLIWRVFHELQEQDSVGAARSVFRDLLALLGARLAEMPASREECLAPLVDGCLAVRGRFKQEKQWLAADAVRDCLLQAGIVVEDTPQGVRWRLDQ